MQCSVVQCVRVCQGVLSAVLYHLSSLGVGQAADGDVFFVELEGVHLRGRIIGPDLG